MIIRQETPSDRDSIHRLTADAFAHAPHRSGREQDLIAALRAADVLSLSLVAEAGGQIVGHAAFTDITVDGRPCHWHGLGPVSVHPDVQRRGIGSRLILDGLARLQHAGSQGCVVLGDPAYYGRFGFSPDAHLQLAGVPAEFFLVRPFDGDVPTGYVAYHPLFATVL